VRHGRCRHHALCDVRGYGLRCSGKRASTGSMGRVLRRPLDPAVVRPRSDNRLVPVLAQLAASVCAHRRHTDCGYDHGLAAGCSCNWHNRCDGHWFFCHLQYSNHVRRRHPKKLRLENAWPGAEPLPDMPCCPTKAPIPDCGKDYLFMAMCATQFLASAVQGVGLVIPLGLAGVFFPGNDTDVADLSQGPPPRPPLRGCLTENLALISDPVFPHRKDDAKISPAVDAGFSPRFSLCLADTRENTPPSFFNRRAASFLLVLQMRLQLSRLRVPQRHVGRHGDRTLPTRVPHLRRWNS
jgi:hypothetical protein